MLIKYFINQQYPFAQHRLSPVTLNRKGKKLDYLKLSFSVELLNNFSLSGRHILNADLVLGLVRPHGSKLFLASQALLTAAGVVSLGEDLQLWTISSPGTLPPPAPPSFFDFFLDLRFFIFDDGDVSCEAMLDGSFDLPPVGGPLLTHSASAATAATAASLAVEWRLDGFDLRFDGGLSLSRMLSSFCTAASKSPRSDAWAAFSRQCWTPAVVASGDAPAVTGDEHLWPPAGVNSLAAGCLRSSPSRSTMADHSLKRSSSTASPLQFDASVDDGITGDGDELLSAVTAVDSLTDVSFFSSCRGSTLLFASFSSTAAVDSLLFSSSGDDVCNGR